MKPRLARAFSLAGEFPKVSAPAAVHKSKRKRKPRTPVQIYVTRIDAETKAFALAQAARRGRRYVTVVTDAGERVTLEAPGR